MRVVSLAFLLAPMRALPASCQSSSADAPGATALIASDVNRPPGRAALNTSGTGRTIYFPPGTYRVTSMLRLGPRGDAHMGMTLLGHGRATRLAWDGAAGGNLLQINGNPYSRYEGLTLDGRNVASSGFFVSNNVRFETSIKLKHMAFRNFTDYGVCAVKETSPIAMAETSYENCIFENCGTGIFLGNFNDYNHTVAGCDFIGRDAPGRSSTARRLAGFGMGPPRPKADRFLAATFSATRATP